MSRSDPPESAAEPAQEEGGRTRGKGLPAVGGASVIAAGASYLILFLAARALSPEENAQFLTFWAVLFLILGIIAGIINEFTRAVRTAATDTGRSAHGAAVFPLGLLIGCGGAVVITASSPLWAPSILPDDTILLVAVLAVTSIAYAGHCSLAGAAGGSQRWSLFAGLAASEALLRLLLVVVVVLTVSTRVGLEAASAAGALTWLLILLFARSSRSAVRARADVGTAALLANTGHAMVSAAATAALVTGFPILLRLTTPLEQYAGAAPLILAISLTRAPIMIPLQAFQSVLISRFVGVTGTALVRAIALPAAALLVLGGVGAIAAGLLGPWIMLVFGPAYVVAPLTMAALTFAGCLMAVLTVTGTACLARGAHTAYSVGWLTATASTFLLLLLPGSLESRAILSLVLGPVVGALVHLTALLTSSGRRAAETSAEEGIGR
ncbi:polysaccharide biosynthesis protein [Arthrobacter sp. MDT3-44]